MTPHQGKPVNPQKGRLKKVSKRICALLLAMLMLLSLCACGASSGQATSGESVKEEAAVKETPAVPLSPLEKLIAEAEAGSTEAMVKLGDMYRDGDGVEADMETAGSWYEKAGDAGDGNAYQWLGNMYYNASGDQKDYGRAFEAYTKSADAGVPDGMGMLGLFYGNGYGVEQDTAKAAQWYEKAADAGCAWAMKNLCFLYMYTLHDDEKAEKYLLKAAETGDSGLMATLGDFYSDFEGRGRRDYAKAVEWYTKSAEAEDPSAYGTFQLGEAYNYGYGVQKDYEKAFELFNRAVELWQAQNSTDEIFAYTVEQIGDMYSYGRGVEKDKEKAAEYYKWADELNSR